MVSNAYSTDFFKPNSIIRAWPSLKLVLFYIWKTGKKPVFKGKNL
jgi:hypothetical protein